MPTRPRKYCVLPSRKPPAFQGKLAAYMHSHSFATVVGEVAFGRDGEWVNPRMLVTQWQHLESNDVAQLTDLSKWVVQWPPQHKTGELIYPFSERERAGYRRGNDTLPLHASRPLHFHPVKYCLMQVNRPAACCRLKGLE